VFTVALQPDHVHAALAQRLELPAGGGAGVLTALGGGVMVLVFLALRATFAAVAVLLEPVFALVRLLLKLVVVFAVVVALVVFVGLGKLGRSRRGRRDRGAHRHPDPPVAARRVPLGRWSARTDEQTSPASCGGRAARTDSQSRSAATLEIDMILTGCPDQYFRFQGQDS
jgi:hypothetical protein